MEFNVFEVVQQFAVLPVAGLCVLLGYLLKHVWQSFPDKYIPLALLPVAMACVLWLNGWAFTFEIIMSGVCSAALAVYFHQNGKQLLSKKADSSEDGTGGADHE